MRRFEVGDKVVVARKYDHYDTDRRAPPWNPRMDATIGKIGTVVSCTTYDHYVVDMGSPKDMWYYHVDSLDPLLDTAEVDPTGLLPSDPGAKLDEGKVLADDILRGFAKALLAVCELGTVGARKYSLNGWKEVKDGFRRYANAGMRHKLQQWIKGNDSTDPETKVLEQTAVAWNELAKLQLLIEDLEEKNNVSEKEPTQSA